MTRMHISLGLALACLSTAVAAANMIWASFSGNCQACLDRTFTSCPGNYQTVEYATCMCAGQGGANVNTCLGYCNPNYNEPANVVNSFYMYCALFFPSDVCPAAARVFDQKTMDRLCSPEAIAKVEGAGKGPGSSSGSSPGSGSGSNSGPAPAGVAVDGTGNAGGPKATGSAGAQAGTTSTSKALAATAVALPGLGLVAGVGMAVVHMNL